jgi:hypothetical protein
MRRLLPFAMLCACVLSSALSYAGETLEGLPALIRVVVAAPTEMYPRDITTLAELELRKAGFRVSEDAAARLGIDVKLLSATADTGAIFGYFVVAQLALIEPVRLGTPPEYEFRLKPEPRFGFAATWSTLRLAHSGSQDGARVMVRRAVQALLESFINEYLAANPRTER